MHAETGLGRHKKAYAVPLPGKVVIDGKLDDWDLSGQIEMFVMSETKEGVLERDTGDPEPLTAKET